jgi:hypothetical protein
MAATNETTNYKLPLFTDNDQPTWLGDFNGAMEKVDAGMNTIGANASTALSAANNAVNRVGQVETTIAGVQTTANNAYSLSTANEQAIAANEQAIGTLENKFPITSNSLSNGAVTAAKLDQTAIAAMWAGLTVKRFASSDASADNTGAVVPSGANLEGFYIVELGLLVLNSMDGTYSNEQSCIFTLPSYVPANAETGNVTDCSFIVWDTSQDFKTWSSLYAIKGTRQFRISTYPHSGDKFSLLSSTVLYMGANTGFTLGTQNAYQKINPTVG